MKRYENFQNVINKAVATEKKLDRTKIISVYILFSIFVNVIFSVKNPIPLYTFTKLPFNLSVELPFILTTEHLLYLQVIICGAFFTYFALSVTNYVNWSTKHKIYLKWHTSWGIEQIKLIESNNHPSDPLLSAIKTQINTKYVDNDDLANKIKSAITDELLDDLDEYNDFLSFYNDMNVDI